MEILASVAIISWNTVGCIIELEVALNGDEPKDKHMNEYKDKYVHHVFAFLL